MAPVSEVGSLAAWPPAFAPRFLSEARTRMQSHPVLVVVAQVGTNRVELVEALAADEPDAVWADTTIRTGAFDTLRDMFAGLDLDPGTSVAEAAQHLRTHLATPPLVVLVDADLRDAASVETLVRCADDGLLRLLATAGPASMGTVSWGADPDRIDLEPLDTATVERLLQERFGARPHPTVVTMLQARAVGAYSVLREVTDLAMRRDEIRVASDVLMLGPGCDAGQQVPGTGPGFDDHLPSRTLADDHPAREVLETVSFLTVLAWDDAQAIFTGRALRAAEHANVVHREEDTLVISSPIEGLTRRHRLPPDERRRLLDRVLPHLHRSLRLPRSAVQLAEWIVSTGGAVDTELATVAVGRANRENRYQVALSVADATGDPTTWPSRLIVEHLYALHCAGHHDATVERLRSIDVSAIESDDLIELLYWCVVLLPSDEADVVVADAIRAADQASDSWSATLELARLVADMFQESHEEVVTDAEALLESGRLTPVNRSLAHTLLAVAHRHRGRLDASVAAATEALRGLETADAASYHRDFVLETLIASLLAQGDLATAADRLVDYGEPGSAYGNFGRVGTALWAGLEYNRGDLTAALACAESSIARTPRSDPFALIGWVQASVAQILAQLGRDSQARVALAASEVAPAPERVIHDLERWTAQARAHDLLGDPERAILLLETVHARAVEHSLTWYAVQAAALLVQIEGPVRLDVLQQTTAGLTDLGGSTSWWQRFGDAMAANDMRSLVDLAQELSERGVVMEAAEVAQFTLDVARRAADMSPAERERLREIAEPMQHRHVER